jgi:hypothetical protein
VSLSQRLGAGCSIGVTGMRHACEAEAGAQVTDIVLSIVMLAAIALVVGAVILWRRTGEVKNPALMALLAVIAVINVLIWTIPTESGVAPIEQLKVAGEG